MSRLIDADALKRKVVEWMPCDLCGMEERESPFEADIVVSLMMEIEEAPTIEPEPHWVPVSERLPDAEKKTYWVCTDSGYQCQCRWTNINHFWTDLTTDWHWHIMDVPQYSKVVAWRELPPPYSEETNDEMICYEVQREDLATKNDKRFFNALKPNKEIDRSGGISREVPVCPNCEAIISPMYFWKNCENKVGWCEYCGQKIDWSGWEG